MVDVYLFDEVSMKKEIMEILCSQIALTSKDGLAEICCDDSENAVMFATI